MRRYSVNLTNYGSGAATTATGAVPGRAFRGLFVGIYDGPTGALLLDATTFVRSGDFGTDENGYADANITLELSQNEQVRIFDAPGVKHLRISWNGITVYEGRLQDTTMQGLTAGITAFGYRAALGDTEYSGTFSLARTDSWNSASKEVVPGQNKDKYNSDFDGRVYATLKKNLAYDNNGDAFMALVDVPHGASDLWKYVTAYLIYNLPSGWTIRFFGYIYPFDSFVSSNITTSGGTSAGATVTWDLSATPRSRIGIQVYNSSGGTYTNGQDDGVYFVELTDIRATFSDATVTAQDVAQKMVSVVNALNSTQLQSSTSLIQNPGLEIYNYTAEDKQPKDILTELTTLGDTQTIPRVWEWGVWDDRYLHFQPRGYLARELYIDVVDPKVQRTLSGLANSFYVRYRDASGRSLRTTPTANSNSITRNGITIRRSANSTSTNAGGAQSQAAMYLNEYATPIPRSEIRFTNVYDSGGNLFPPFLARSGDNVTLRNVPQTAGETLARARQFRVKRTKYDLMTGMLEITPENDLPTLVTMLTRDERNYGLGVGATG